MASDLTVDLIIHGEWRAPSSGHYDAVSNPASPDETVGLVASASREDVRAAIDAAHAAQPDWAVAGYLERAAALRRMTEAVQEGAEARARILTKENGKTL
jgi:succinate-semialdehyde dehydrogenase/glutarate-semialdehyde dehydrogenase